MYRKIETFLVAILCVFCVQPTTESKECIRRSYNYSSFACVCNSTYCDDIGIVEQLPRGSYILITSTMEGLRFDKKYGAMRPISKLNSGSEWLDNIFNLRSSLKVDRGTTYQYIHGFGVSFTDSVGINLLKVSKRTKDNILKSYFDETGIECNLCRVPIGGTDFSTHGYAYNMYPEHDEKLSNFSLTMEDYKYKIPFIKEAMAMSKTEIYLIGSVWSPPKWMKLNNDYVGITTMFTKYYQTYADYHVRFLEEYEKSNISFWGITPGNEPAVGLGLSLFNSLGWTPTEYGEWIEKNFGPTIRMSKFKDIKILGFDENRFALILWFAEMIDTKPKALDYMDGIGLHWYTDFYFSETLIDEVIEMAPDKFLIMTEVGSAKYIGEVEDHMRLGSWDRAENYMERIIDNFQHKVGGWIEWNLALDTDGGPSWVSNFIEAPIMVLEESDEFLKMPIYYALGHISKFVPRGSFRIKVEVLSGSIEHIAFLRPDNGITILFYNPAYIDKTITIQEEGKGFVEVNVPRKSMQTLVYW